MRSTCILGSGLVTVALALSAASCSAVGDDGGENGSGSGSGGGSQGSGSGSGGDDIGLGGGQAGGAGGAEVCSAIEKEATPALQAADIVFVVDTSGSMSDENAFVNANLDDFSQQIILSGIDVRVIMLAESQLVFPVPLPVEPPGVCVAAPLGSGACPDDTNLPQYFHAPGSEVGSTDGLNVILGTYSSWAGNLRQGATKTIVAITDDNHSQAPFDGPDLDAEADEFIAALESLDPAMWSSWKMSGIYSHTMCPDAASVGALWEKIIDKTGGLKGDLCLQQFQPIFDDLATQIIIGAAQLDCQWAIPAPPEGETLDPNKVNVVYTDGAGVEHTLGNVANEAACDTTQGGWYYDDNQNPTNIELCPASCDMAQTDVDGKMDILFGCATEVLTPT